jgi:hypothetical protein
MPVEALQGEYQPKRQTNRKPFSSNGFTRNGEVYLSVGVSLFQMREVEFRICIASRLLAILRSGQRPQQDIHVSLEASENGNSIQ